MGDKNTFYKTEGQLYETEQVRNGQYVQCIAPIRLSFMTGGGGGDWSRYQLQQNKHRLLYYQLSIGCTFHKSPYAYKQTSC